MTLPKLQQAAFLPTSKGTIETLETSTSALQAQEAGRNQANAETRLEEPKFFTDVVQEGAISRLEFAKDPDTASMAVTPETDQSTQSHATPVSRVTEAVLAPVKTAYDVMLGTTKNSPQYGILGEVAGRRIALDLNETHTISLFGVQGGGKSYTLGSIVEMATTPLFNLNQLQQPLASVIFHYSQTQEYAPEFVSMRFPNDEITQLKRLKDVFGAEPAALEDIVLLAPKDKVETRRAEFPGVAVLPLLFAADELQASHWRFLMNAVGNQANYMRQLNLIMRDNRNDLTVARLREAVNNSDLPSSIKNLANQRLNLAEGYIEEGDRISDIIRPGRLIIVDLRDEFIEKDEALGLFVVLLQLFADARHSGKAFNKLVVFDEAHKYIDDPDLIKSLVEVIREMRHKGTSILVASQDPPSVPIEVIELSSHIILHKFNSPAWLKHIQRANTALGNLSAGNMAALRPGEAYVWSSKSSDASFSERAMKLICRPRATRHGGSTKTAVAADT
jgi:DNA phosphorothioation-dependent restriction protein DptH